MKGLVGKLFEYLLKDTTESDTLLFIKNSELSYVTENAVTVKWSNDLEEFLRLNKEGKLFNMNETALKLMGEKADDIILVADGDMFEGTRDQFRDCFFDNANNDQIISWCRTNGWSLVINAVKFF